MQQETSDLESQRRSLMNRKREIESQMNDLQSDMSKIKRIKDEAELEVRAKRKEIERLKVELTDIEIKSKQREQDLFELQTEYFVIFTSKSLALSAYNYLPKYSNINLAFTINKHKFFIRIFPPEADQLALAS